MASGESKLSELLKGMAPVLVAGEFVFITIPNARYGDRAELNPIASFRESEGLTLVVPKQCADENSSLYEGVFSAITLQIHSSLEAVGLTAAFSKVLTENNISANVIAGFYHDHIFVPVDSAEKAMEAIHSLSH